VRVFPDDAPLPATLLVPPDPEGRLSEDTLEPGGALEFGLGSEGFVVGSVGIFVCLVVVVVITAVEMVESGWVVLSGGILVEDGLGLQVPPRVGVPGGELDEVCVVIAREEVVVYFKFEHE
jgi:hypothetical protein